MSTEDTSPPDPRVFLIANGFGGIVAPGDCGCRLDELMPCGIPGIYCDGVTGIPKGCQPGYSHADPRGGPDWVVSTKKETPSQEAFDLWINNS